MLSTTSVSAGRVSLPSASSRTFGNGFTAAGSLEQAEYIYSATNANAQLLHRQRRCWWRSLQRPANYSNNVAPDLILKGTYDAKYGHFEIGGTRPLVPRPLLSQPDPRRSVRCRWSEQHQDGRRRLRQPPLCPRPSISMLVLHTSGRYRCRPLRYLHSA